MRTNFFQYNIDPDNEIPLCSLIVEPSGIIALDDGDLVEHLFAINLRGEEDS